MSSDGGSFSFKCHIRVRSDSQVCRESISGNMNQRNTSELLSSGTTELSCVLLGCNWYKLLNAGMSSDVLHMKSHLFSINHGLDNTVLRALPCINLDL